MLLEIKHVTKNFDGMTAIRDLSLSFEEGQLHCIIGPNGSGKTTLFNLITGYYTASSGWILYEGTDITKMPVHKIGQMGICRKFQNPNVFSELSVEDNLRVAMIGSQSIRSFFFRADEDAIHKEIDQVLEVIKLPHKRNWTASALSHGEKQWLEIGMVLIKQPKIILLDEPTAGMTSQETAQTSQLIQNICATATVIVIEHDLDFIRSLNGHVIVLNRGEFLAAGSYEQIAANQTVRDIYLGDEA